MSHKEENDALSGKGQFGTTHWSLVLTAGKKSSPDARAALSALCQTYWRPLYAYVRRRVTDLQEAQDLTQEFFARLLERNDLAVADPDRGRFRSFLLAALKNFLLNEWKKAKAQKRGGGQPVLSMDFAADSQGRFEPAVNSTPERDFDRDWALTLIHQVMNRLQQEYIDAGKQTHFDHLKKFISRPDEPDAYRQAAQILNMSESALRTAAHRLRKRYRKRLKEEIARTVATPEEVDEEIHNLFAALCL